MTQPPDYDLRRSRRRRERQQFFSYSSLFAIGLIIGIVGSIWLAWRVFPLTELVGSPAVFQQTYRDEYLYMVSEALAQTGDWEAAQARLDLLEDDNLPQTVVQELERYLREGRSAEDVRHMARLAQGLGAEGAALDLFAPTPGAGSAPESGTPTPTLIVVVGQAAESQQQLPTATPTLLPTPTPIPEIAVEAEPTATPLSAGAQLPFELLAQEEVCVGGGSPSQIEVFVQDGAGEGVAGEEILVSWEGGTDRFVTGLKREVDAGYADFTLSAGISYSAELVAGSPRVSGLTIGVCEDGSAAGWRLVFGQN